MNNDFNDRLGEFSQFAFCLETGEVRITFIHIFSGDLF